MTGSQKTNEGSDSPDDEDLYTDAAYYLEEVEGGAFVSDKPFPVFDLDSELTEKSQPPRVLSVAQLRSESKSLILSKSWLNNRMRLEAKRWDKLEFMELNESLERAGVALHFYGARLLDALSTEITENINHPPEEELAKSCCRIIEGLGHIASKEANELALKTLLKIARLSADTLERMAITDPELVQSVSKSEKTWPLNLGVRNHQIKDAKKNLRDQIKLGSAIINESQQSANFKKTATKTALALIQYVEKFRSSHLFEPSPEDDFRGIPESAYRTFDETYPFSPLLAERMRSLPELSIESHEEWADACWELLMETTNGQPERTDSLCKARTGESEHYNTTYDSPEDSPAVEKRHRRSLKTGLLSSIASIAKSYKEIKEKRFISGMSHQLLKLQGDLRSMFDVVYYI